MRPQAANFGQTGVEVGRLEVHLHLAGFENAEAQKVLDEVLQALPAGAHVAQDLALPLVQSAQLLALQELDVAVQNGQRSLEVMGGRGEGIGGALKSLLQLGELLQQILATARGRGKCLGRVLGRAQLGVIRFRLFRLRQTRLFRRCGHYLELSDLYGEGGWHSTR